MEKRTARAALRPAVFLDRDGTLVAQVHHLRDPDDVRLIPGAGAALRLLHAAGRRRAHGTRVHRLRRG